MKLLLHACCGPCSLEPVRLLQNAGYTITIAYANSNIHPKEEYHRRLDTLRAWTEAEGIPVLELPYQPSTWEDAVAPYLPDRANVAGMAGVTGMASATDMAGASDVGMAGVTDATGVSGAADTPDADDEASDYQALRQARCRACYRLRLEEVARTAAELGFDALSTTLSVSPYQYTDVIQEELSRAAKRAGVDCIFKDFRSFYAEATRRSRELGMYRQNYCGCRISQAEAERERTERKRAREAERTAYRAAHAEELAAQEEARQINRAEKEAYAAKQARKHAILKELRARERAEQSAGQGVARVTEHSATGQSAERKDGQSAKHDLVPNETQRR